MKTPGGPPISRTSNPMMPGSWEPGRFNLSDAVVIKATLIFMAFLRGIDWLTPTVTSSPTPVTETMQTAFPLEIWALMIMAPATVLLIGLVLRIHFFVWLGHGLLAVTYMGLFTSLLLVYAQRPYFDGIRSATVLLAPLVLHTLLVVRTGWRPPRWDLSEDLDANE